MKKNHQWNLSYFAIAFVVLTLVQFLFIDRRVVQSIPYSQFLQLLNEQKVSDLRVEKDQISGKLQEPIDGHNLFSTVRVDPALATDLAQSGVGFTGVNENTFLNGLLGWLLPHGVIEIPAILIAGQAGLVLALALIGWGKRTPLTGRLRAVSRDLVTLICGVGILLIWAGFVEAFLSQYHEPILPYELKISFGLIELILLWLFLAKSGKESSTFRVPGSELGNPDRSTAKTRNSELETRNSP